MAVFNCKMCGGDLEVHLGESIAVCQYCGRRQTLPHLDSDQKTILYDRANHFRRNNEYDKASGIYEQILNEDGTDAEAYWSLVLCRYGIEYVEDSATHRRVPTINRAQFTSVFDDENYKSALQHADERQKEIYKEEAQSINTIQKGFLEISQEEEPFDVFICYKETDNNGRRTQDSVLATELYQELIKEDFKVFFSRITLEDKLGQEYEPYIFAALNSAKVMVVVGISKENFNAVWVKNEWSRYLTLIKGGAEKIIIPAYRDMDPYDLPEEFSHLQAQDMSKLGFMQDLVRGIKKIIQKDKPKVETIVLDGGSTNAEPLLTRAFLFLEDGEWDSANEYCEKVLDIDPENAMAYVGKLCVELQVRSMKYLAECKEPFADNNNYKKAIRFADEELKKKLNDTIQAINDRSEKKRLDGIYSKAMIAMNFAKTEQQFKEAAEIFYTILTFRDSAEKNALCNEKAEEVRKNAVYGEALSGFNSKKIDVVKKAQKQFESIAGWKNADDKAVVCAEKIKKLEEKRSTNSKLIIHKNKIAIIFSSVTVFIVAVIVLTITVVIPTVKYNDAVVLMDDGKKAEAAIAFGKVIGYKDARKCSMELWDEIAQRETVFAGGRHTVGLKADGTVVAVGNNGYGQCDVSDWKDIVAISAERFHTVGLKADGTVVAVGDNDNGQCDVSDWKDIVAVYAGECHTVGLKSDGTVVAVGDNDNGQCNVSNWKDIIAVSAGECHTVGLKADGTVVAVGDNDNGQCDVSNWKDIVAVSASGNHTLGLKADGTVVDKVYGKYVSDWKDIVAVSSREISSIVDTLVGLKSDGTVVAVGANCYGECDVSGWTDIIAVSTGGFHTVGLKSDGTVVATKFTVDAVYSGQSDVSDWSGIKVPKK